MSNYFPSMTHESRFFSDLHRYRRNTLSIIWVHYMHISAAYSENLWIWSIVQAITEKHREEQDAQLLRKVMQVGN